MIYMQATEGRKIIVLETANIEEIMKNRPAITQDGSVVIGWTPDAVWLADKLMDSGGDGATICRLIDEAVKRPQKGPRPHHEPHEHRFSKVT